METNLSKKIILITFLMVLTYRTFAVDFEDAVFPELAISSRALAMGNAYLAKSDDNYAAFYNPAGLGTVRYTQFHLTTNIETNNNWIQNSSEGNFLNFFSNLPDSFNLEGTRRLLLRRRDQITFGRLHLLPHFTTRYFTAGYLYAKRNKSLMRAGTAPFEFAKRTDHGPYTAMNLSFSGGIFKVGVMGILLNRYNIQGDLPNNMPVALTNRQKRRGNAFIMNFGSKITLPITYLPTFSLQTHNALGQKFSTEDGLLAPHPIKRTVDVGFSLTPQTGRNGRMHIEANYRDIGEKYNITTLRRIALGIEFDFSRIFFFRLGYGDGYGSFGLGFKTQDVAFDLTSYAVDTTADGFRGRADRRFALSISAGI